MQEGKSFFFFGVSQALRTSKNLDAWEDAKREIEKIPPHPNRAPPAAEKPQDMGSVSSAGRDSAAIVNGR